MADSILITASLRIARAPEEVRAQYRDIDHHIRNNVHPGIHYAWEPAPAGQRKIRTKFRILGVPQYDVSLLEDTDDGSFLIRYLEGTNAGMLLEHRFVPLPDGATDVRLSATAPATLGRRLLGPLFVLGARQVMKKALAEDQRDLEGGRFRPGVAAGDLSRAFAPLLSLRSADAARRAVLDATLIAAAADGAVEAAERDAVRKLADFLGLGAERGVWSDRIEQLAAFAGDTQLTTAAEASGQKLAALGVAEEGLSAAAAIALVSQGLSLGELALLRRMSAAARVDDERLAELIERTDSALAGT